MRVCFFYRQVVFCSLKTLAKPTSKKPMNIGYKIKKIIVIAFTEIKKVRIICKTAITIIPIVPIVRQRLFLFILIALGVSS